jgi:hypothetical protein
LFIPDPDPGSRGQKGTGSRIRIRNPVWKINYFKGKCLIAMIGTLSETSSDRKEYRNCPLFLMTFKMKKMALLKKKEI